MKPISLILLLIIGCLSCEAPIKPLKKASISPSSVKIKSDSSKYTELVRSSSEGITLEYTLKPKLFYGKSGYIYIDGTITNTSNTTKYYLTFSCDDGRLLVDEKHHELKRDWEGRAYCNMSWPMVAMISPKGSEKITGYLLKEELTSLDSKIGLNMLFVDHYIPFEEMKKNEYYCTNVLKDWNEKSIIIWGKRK